MEPLNSKDPKSIGGFTLVGRLGKGGMGVVYLASRKSVSVALKVIRDSLIDDDSEATRFSREVATLEKISSLNVAGIIDAGVDEGRAWFAAEFVNGPNLSELVNDKGPLDEDQWWELAKGLLNGLADVHKTGVIHRDIKPANVIMAETGPKLIDFGIAHVSDATSVTATGLVAGSPAWFSPEQIEGFELTPATDVFSAGSVLTFAASGSSPWGGETTMTKASVFKILTSEPELSSLTDAQRFLVEHMLEKEPSLRPTAESLNSNIDGIRAGSKPDFETHEGVPAQISTEATAIVERAALIQTGKATTESSITRTRNNMEASSSAPPQKKRNRLVAVSLTLVALVGASLLVMNSSGTGKVSVEAKVYEGNPAIGDFALRLSSGSIEPIVLDLDSKNFHKEVFAWRSGEPIRISYEPPFSEDEEFVGTVMPSDLGLNGFSNGQSLIIYVSLERNSTLLSFRTGRNSSANEVYAVRLARGNEKLAVEACVDELQPKIELATSGHKALYDRFVESEIDAQLDGYRNLTSVVWRNRFDNLYGMLQANRELANQSYASYDPALQGVAKVNSASIELEQAAAGLGAVAARYLNAYIPDEPWDAAWNAYYAAQRSLSSAVSGLSPATLAKSDCNASIE